MSASGVSIANEKTLQKLGLSLEPVSGGVTMYAGGSEASQGQMRLNVTNKTQFLSFLSSLEQEHIKNAEIRRNLQDLVEVLSRQLSGHYNLENPQDEMLELFGGLEGIINQYKRLGLDASVIKLETYLNHARNGSLREFIEIEKHQLLGKPGESFGPSDWQKDSGSAGVSERWERALNVLRRLKSNPKSQELYQQLFDHLNFSLDVARNSTVALTYLSSDSRASLEHVFDQVGAELAEMGKQKKTS